MENLHSIHIEQSVLSLFMTFDNQEQYIDQLQESDFYASRHAYIFAHIKKQYSLGRGYDVEVINDIVSKDVAQVVKSEYIVDLFSKTSCSVVQLPEYVKTLRDYSRRRSLFNAGERIKKIAGDLSSFTPNEAIAQSESVLACLDVGDNQPKLSDAYNCAIDLFNRMQQRMIDREGGYEKLNGVRTGFKWIDQKIGLLQNGDLIYVGARPSMGKTAFAQTLMLEIAFTQQLPILFQSIEMSSSQITERLVSALSSVNLKDIKQASLKNEDWRLFNDAVIQLQKCKFLIDDSSVVTISDIKRNARKLKAEHGVVGAIFIDYLTLIKGEDKGERNDLSVGGVSNGLKAIAKEFNCPVVCLAQLNRSLEKRNDKRPLLSDLRESGSIEQDADIVMFLYRDEYYDKKTKDVGVAEVIIAKARDGEVGTVRLGFEGEYSRFSELLDCGSSDYDED